VGSHMEYRVRTEVGTLFVVSDNVDRVVATGEATGIAFAQSGPVLLPS